MVPPSIALSPRWPRRFRHLAVLAVLAACVDQPFAPGTQTLTTVRLALTLPSATPPIWTPIGETLHVAVRRAGRAAPILDTSFIIADTLGALLSVPLDYGIERFVATADVRYGSTVLFLGFEAVQLRAGVDTSVTLAADYVGPGARAASYALAARDTTLGGGDTASLRPQVLDSSGQLIPNVPVRYVVARPALLRVDSAGVITASASAPGDTARITGFLPMGLASALLVRLQPNITPPAGQRTWVGGAGATAADSGDWFNAANWDPAGVPTSADSVLIVDTDNDPVIAGRAAARTLVIGGGILTMARGALLVSGDLVTRGGSQGGALDMSHADDTVRVLGGAVFEGRLGDGMSDGVLIVAGDFVQRDGMTFKATGNHRTVLNGSQPQQLSIANGNAGAGFRQLEIANTGGRVIIGNEDEIHVTGTLRVTTPVTIDNGSGGNGDVALEVEDSLVMAAGSRLTVAELSLGGGMAVAGTFAPQPGGAFRVRFTGGSQAIQSGLGYRDVQVDGDAYLAGPTTFDGGLNVFGSLDVAGHTLTVTGDLHTENGDGRIVMQHPADRLTVLGDATFEGDSVPGLMTDGVLRIAGHFRQLRYSNTRGTFRASGAHRTVFDGASRQNLQMADPVTFGHLDIANTSGTVGIDAERVVVAGTMRLSTAVALIETGSEPTLELDVGDSVITVAGSRLEAVKLTVRGVVAFAGVLDADIVEFAGANQVIPAGLPYQSIEVSGSARLGGRIATGQSVRVHGAQASLALNGNTLEVATLITGNGAGLPVTGGTIVMLQPADSLIVTDLAAFGAAATPGSLGAGVLAITGSMFFQTEVPEAFQPGGTHRTVLTNPAGTRVDFQHPGSGANAAFFRNLQVSTSGNVFMATNVTVTGMLSGGNPVDPPVLSGAGTTLSAGGADAAGMIFRDLRLSLGSGLIRLDSVTFDQQSPAATQLSVVHPGSTTPFALTGLRFLTAPTSGYYISATDAAPADGTVLTLSMAGSTPADGSARTQVTGGAIVNWPDAPVPFVPTAVSVGWTHSCASSGTIVACWGANGSGQLGDGTTQPRANPVRVTGGPALAQVAAGGLHTCALSATGAAYCWGANGDGQLGDGTTTDRLTPVPVSGGLTFVALTSGGGFSCGLTAAGAAYCWGRNNRGQLGNGTTTGSSVPVAVATGLPFTALDAGALGEHVCALGTTGLAYCWGLNSIGQLGDGTQTQRTTPTPVDGALQFSSIAASYDNSCGITAAGQGYCWGRGVDGELGDGLATNRSTPGPIAGGLSLKAIDLGTTFGCALTTAGAAYCWGGNVWGQLGDGTTTSHGVPAPVSGGHTFTALSVGHLHVAAVTSANTWYGWGLLVGNTGVKTPTLMPLP